MNDKTLNFFMFINCDQFIEFQNAFYVSSIEMYYSLDLSRV